MKTCPYCAEEIQENAIKCKHCGEELKNDIVKGCSVNNNLYLPISILLSVLIIGGFYFLSEKMKIDGINMKIEKERQVRLECNKSSKDEAIRRTNFNCEQSYKKDNFWEIKDCKVNGSYDEEGNYTNPNGIYLISVKEEEYKKCLNIAGLK